MTKTITVVEEGDILCSPPVINLVENLLFNGYEVNLIGKSSSKLAVSNHEKLHAYEMGRSSSNATGKLVFVRAANRLAAKKDLAQATKEAMREADVLWTTSANTVRALGDVVLGHRHVMQLMELQRYCFQYKNYVRFPIDEYARKAWKVVVPELNRAYIQKVWWSLPALPAVLPNKPYRIELGQLGRDQTQYIERMREDSKMRVLYLGGIFADRDLDKYAAVIERNSDQFSFYIVGKAFDSSAREYLNCLMRKYPSIVYCGSFPPPQHLHFAANADIGLLPYKPVASGSLSELNALYCAPNKIFEYSAFGVPMLGSDVMGLRIPFDEFDIGKYADFDEGAIEEALFEIAERKDAMARNCIRYFDSVDLDSVVAGILDDTMD